MSKKQRDSLYAEVQKHQQSQECLVHSAREESGDISDHGCAYRRGSGTALGDLDEITTLPEGLLFDLPLTPEDGGGDYCNLEMLGGSAGSSSSSQSSPEQNNLDCVDKHGIKHEYQLLHNSGLFSHAIHTPLPEACSLLDTGQYKQLHLLTARWYVAFGTSQPTQSPSFPVCCRAYNPECDQVSYRDQPVQHRGVEEDGVDFVQPWGDTLLPDEGTPGVT